VTGGAGFIGSHLAERLIKAGHEVIVLDNLRTGKQQNLKGTNKSNLVFVRGDLLDRKIIRESLDGVSIVFHLAANPEVRVGVVDTSVDFQQNLVATYNLLDEMKKTNSARKVVFASTSTVYGEPAVIPTPEDYGPLIPISRMVHQNLDARP
jgi:UDP-glucose 4-epimerase